MVMGMVVMRFALGGTTHLVATTGMFLRAALVVMAVRGMVVMFVFLVAAATIGGVAGGFGFRSTAATIDRFGRRALGQKLLPAMLAAKIVRLSVALGVQRRRFVHGHSTNRVGLHLAFRCWLSKRSFASFTLANADPGILLHSFRDTRTNRWAAAQLLMEFRTATLRLWPKPKTP
jgi:hypothetical protein